MKKILLYSDGQQDCELIKYMLKNHPCEMIVADTANQAPEAVDYAFISLSLPKIKTKVIESIILLADPDQTIELIHHDYPQSLVTLITPIKRSDLSRALELVGISNTQSAGHFNQLIDLRIYLKESTTKVINSPILSESLHEGLIHFCLFECGKAKSLQSADHYQHSELLQIDPSGHLKVCPLKPNCLVHHFIRYLEELSPESKKLLHAPLIELIGDPLTLSFDQLAKNIDDYIHNLLSIRRNFCGSTCQHAQHNNDFQQGDQVLVELDQLIKGKCVYCRYESCALSNVFKHFSDYLGTIK